MGLVPRKLAFSNRSLPKKVIFSYIGDYVILFVIFVAMLTTDWIEPYHQQFSLRNYTLQYKYAVHERVPVWLCYLLVAIFPGLVILFYTQVIDGIFSNTGLKRKRYRFKDRLWELNCGWLGLALAFGAAFDITATLKNVVGKPRPDMISRCMPREGSADPLPFGLSDYTICTQTNMKIMNDGFRSFPSGHSSTSFAGLFYLSLYLAGKLHIFDSKGEVWKTVIVVTPTVCAALIAATRIMDARHHPFDVLSGSALGILCAWVSYRQYFPPLSDYKAKGRAYPIRSWGESLSTSDPTNTYAHQPLPDEEQATTSLARSATGNVFRDEISASKRQRRHDSLRRAPPSSTYSASPSDLSDMPPPIPAHAQLPSYTPAPPGQFGAAPVQGRRDIWDEESSEDDAGSDLGHRDHVHSGLEPLRAQDTAYQSPGSVQLGKMPAQSTAGVRVPSIVLEGEGEGGNGGEVRHQIRADRVV